MADSTDCDSVCESVFWNTDWYAPEEQDAGDAEVSDAEVGSEDEENVADDNESGESDDSHESIMHRTWSAETVTFALDESPEWPLDISGEWPTASASGTDSGADELL